MSLETLPRIRVDFNELVCSDLVLLSATDRVKCADGSKLTLQAGVAVIAFEYNEYSDCTAEYLYVQGYAEKSDPVLNGDWTRNALWCCRFCGGIQSTEPSK